MNTPIFTGAATALVTPMDASGNVDYDVFANLIQDQIENGISAIVACGTTGEASTLSDEEHIEVIRFAVMQSAKRVPVIAGTGSNDTAYSVELSTHAKEAGADALLLVTPYYNKTSQKGLVAHFGAVAEKVDLPIVLYNVQSRTNMNIDIETMLELAERYSNIVAVKQCGGIDYFARILDETNLIVYSGDDDRVVPATVLGAKGVISVASNIAPKQVSEMVNLALSGDFKDAGALQLKYQKFMRLLFADVSPILIKSLMNEVGSFKAGKLRLPLVPPNEKTLAALVEEAKRIGFC